MIGATAKRLFADLYAALHKSSTFKVEVELVCLHAADFKATITAIGAAVGDVKKLERSTDVEAYNAFGGVVDSFGHLRLTAKPGAVCGLEALIFKQLECTNTRVTNLHSTGVDVSVALIQFRCVCLKERHQTFV